MPHLRLAVYGVVEADDALVLKALVMMKRLADDQLNGLVDARNFCK